MRDLDRIDCRIISLLQNNARLSNKELAAKVGLAPSSCLERVRRLYAEGILLTAHAAADPKALGIGLQAMISVRLQRHAQPQVESFRRSVLEVREVIAVYHTTGASDFLLHVAVEDADHLRRLTMQSFTTRPEVAQIETSLLFEAISKPELPNFRGPQW
jgi:DNA-binding Lrp family transcriptional regulator